MQGDALLETLAEDPSPKLRHIGTMLRCLSCLRPQSVLQRVVDWLLSGEERERLRMLVAELMKLLLGASPVQLLVDRRADTPDANSGRRCV